MRRGGAALSTVEAALSPRVAPAQEAWPGVALAPALFVAHVAARLPAEHEVAEALATLHTDDLYLACACMHGVAEAVAAFERNFLARLPSEIARMDRSTDFVDEVRQRLRERLLVGPPPRIGDYAGRGRLASWVRVAAVRLAINAWREGQPREQLRAPLGAAMASPETLAGAGEYRHEVEAALKSALTRLGADARELLRQHFVDGMNLEQIGRLRNLDRSNISRRMTAARRFLLAECMRELHERVPQLTRASLESLVRDLRSNIHVTLSAAFEGGD